MQNIDEMIKDAINSIKSATDTAEIIGKPIVNGDGTVILPVSKVSFGFVVGGADIAGKKAQSKKGNNDDECGNTPTGISGGGVTVTPLGFLICGREKRFVNVENDKGNKWMNLFGDIVECLKKDD